ncbi:MAG: PAS domain S-box protein [Acidimicrobiales bacterium]
MATPSDEVLRGLLEAAPDGILAVEADGVIVFANRQAEDLFGWARGDLLGRKVEVLVPPEAIERHVAHRASYIDAPIARPMGLGLQLSARRRDGTEFPAEISLSTVVGADGRPIVMAAVRDVSDRLELERARQSLEQEAQREQSHRLESIGQLAGGIAHDFNNLLGVILNYATLAQRGVDDPVVSDDLDQIRAAAERAADLTRQLLAFARRDAARPEPLDLRELVDQFSRMLERVIGEQTRLVVGVEQGIIVHADRHQLEQVLLNLCLNARDAMPGGGTVTITSGAAQVADGRLGLPSRPYAALLVTDEGEGMAPDVLDRAFEPFFTTKAQGDGTGLGLSTVYGIVRQNGGAVQLHSSPGEGTTVEVLLPMAGPSTPQAAGRAPGVGAGVVLVAEDEEWLRTVVGRMLREQGYEVHLASSADEAEELVVRLAGRVDLVLTDVVMPGRTGPELARSLRERADAPRVLLMTGYAPSSLDLQDERVLAKPFTEQQLLAAIREALDA